MKLSISTSKASDIRAFDSVLEIPDFQDSTFLPAFKNLVTMFSHSPYIYEANHRKTENIKKMYGFFLDFDGEPFGGQEDYNPEIDLSKYTTIEEVKKIFKDYNFILYTSKSHQKDKLKDDGSVRANACDRFHIFIPFEKPLESNFKDFGAVLKSLVNQTKGADKNVKDLARYFFPSPKEAIFFKNDGRFFDYKEYVKKEVEIETEVKSISGDGNDFNIPLLEATLSILLENGEIDNYDAFRNVLAFASGQPADIQNIVADFLSKNPNYNDSKEDILKKIQTFRYSSIAFRTLYKMAKQVQPTFNQGRFYTGQKKANKTLFDVLAADSTWRPDFDHGEAVEYLNSCLGMTYTGLYAINFNNGWQIVDTPRNLLAPLTISYKTARSIKVVSAFKVWNESYKKRLFERVEVDYKKAIKNESDWNVLNLAVRDFSYVPKAINHPDGETIIEPVLNIFKNAICKGDIQKFEYLMTWMAYVTDFQRTGIGVQIKGLQGTGKSTLKEFLKRFLPADATYETAQEDRITGRFNSHMVGKVLFTSEEATFSGSYKASDILKHLITAETLDIEYKNGDKKITLKNYMNILFLSNRDIISKIESDDRRMFIIETSTDFAAIKATETAAFDAFYKALEDKRVLEYFQYGFSLLRQKHSLGWLRNMKNLQTEEKQELKKKTMDPFLSFLVDIVENNGEIEADSEVSGPMGMTKLVKDSFDVFNVWFTPETIYKEFFDLYLSISERRYYDLRTFRHSLTPFIGKTTQYQAWGRLDGKKRRVIKLDRESILSFLAVRGIEPETKEKIEKSEPLEEIKEKIVQEVEKVEKVKKELKIVGGDSMVKNPLQIESDLSGLPEWFDFLKTTSPRHYTKLLNYKKAYSRGDLTVIAAGYDGYKQDIGRVYGLDNIEVYNLLIGE